jgi:type IX secretion system PorP/SprF family membrane protein
MNTKSLHKKWISFKHATMLSGMICCSAGILNAQQDPLFTQYLNNMLVVNPAYAGSRDAMTLVAIHRDQWVGIDGAPTTQNLSWHAPLKNQNFGLGFSIINDEIGPTKQTGVYADFAGRIRLSNKGRIAFGIKGGFNHLQTQLTDLVISSPGDPNFQENLDVLLPNIGVGVYYDRPQFYFGFSIPKILENRDQGVELADSDRAGEARHLFLMMGSLHSLNSQMKLRPSMMFRATRNAPTSAEITLNLIFMDRLGLGAFYRWEDAAGALVSIHLTPQLRFGYAYDYTLSELSGYSKGSHEVMVTYDFIFEEDRIVSPRYF